MIIEIKFVELHSPLFLAGKNFGHKLDHSKILGLEMYYDEDREFYYFIYQGQMARLPKTSINYDWPLADLPKETMDAIDVLREVKAAKKVPQVQKTEQTAKTEKLKTKISAQVSGPTSHVFEPLK